MSTTDDSDHSLISTIVVDLVYLVGRGFEVSVEAGCTDRDDGQAEVFVCLDRAYDPNTLTFWGGDEGIAGALRAARTWAEEHPDE